MGDVPQKQPVQQIPFISLEGGENTFEIGVVEIDFLLGASMVPLHGLFDDLKQHCRGLRVGILPYR